MRPSYCGEVVCSDANHIGQPVPRAWVALRPSLLGSYSNAIGKRRKPRPRHRTYRVPPQDNRLVLAESRGGLARVMKISWSADSNLLEYNCAMQACIETSLRIELVCSRRITSKGKTMGQTWEQLAVGLSNCQVISKHIQLIIGYQCPHVRLWPSSNDNHAWRSKYVANKSTWKNNLGGVQCMVGLGLPMPIRRRRAQTA